MIYDIPERAKMENPSPELRRVAVRVNLSCWVVPNHLVPFSILGEIEDNGGTWHVIKFDGSEAENLIRMATDSLRKSVREAVESCEDSCRAAHDRADDNSEEDPVKACSKYIRATGQIIRRAEKILADYRRAAEGFGVKVVELGISGAVASIQGIKTGVHRQVAMYKRLIARLEENSGAGLAAGIEAGNVHIGIGLDYLQDQGLDVDHEREVFSDSLRPAG